MKTKKMIFAGLIAVALAGAVITSCKKEKTETTTTPDDSAAQMQKASDDSNTEGNSNQAVDDANTVLSAIPNTSGKTDGIESFTVGICGATIDTSQISSGKITLTFDGTTACNGVTRSGTIALQLAGGIKWKNAGATVTMTFTNYKVTKISNSKSLTFNGTHTVTNVSGGLFPSILFGNTLVHKVRANMTLTFDDGTIRAWQAARLKTLSGSGTSIATLTLTATVAGDTTLSGVANTETWGTTRAGDAFTSTLTDLSVNNHCGWNRPTSGVKTITVGSKSLTITAGVDASGNIVSSGCPDYYKINWINAAGVAKQAVITY